MQKQEGGEDRESVSQLSTNYKSGSIECLRVLQDQLKREYLLLEREQRQKSKIKKEIEHTIQDYYTVLVEKKGLGRVVTEDKLSNSYNFVKEIVLSISKDVRAGFELLMMCPLDTAEELSELLLGMFYENINENDPYLKKNTQFAEFLGKKISEEIVDQNFMKTKDAISLSQNLLPPSVQLLLGQFCKLESIKQYFEMLANRVLKKIPHSLRFLNGISRGSVCSPEVETVSFIETNQLNQSQSISINRTTFQSVHEQNQINVKIDEAVEEYKADVISKAEMMPVCLRALCCNILQQLSKTKRIKQQTIHRFIWEILETSYFRPFDHSNPNKWNHFKNSYFTDTVHKIQEAMRRKADANFLERLVDKITNLSRDKIAKKTEQAKKKIVVNGGCVSYRNLYYLLMVIKHNQKHLKPFNERITNRANKIHEMNPNFDFFKTFNNPSTSYLVFTELLYGETLQKDYQSTYSSVYGDHKIKNMLKQILSDNTFHILPYIQRERFLKDVFHKIISEQEIEGEGNFSLGALQHSQQFIMKIKFLVYLMEKEHVDEATVFCEMIEECVQRQAKNIELFQKNKILLLQCLTTVSKAKKLVKTQKEAQKSVDFHLRIVKILDTMQGLNLCITGASTRPEREKFTKTGHRGIIIQNSNNCHHQENIEQGLRHHASSAQEALLIYCELKEVKTAMETGKDIHHIYEALSKILECFKQKCRSQLHISMEDYNYFQCSVLKVVMREIHESLLENKEKSAQELQFQKQLKDLSFIKPTRIKIAGRDNLAELEQVWEIACRYLRNINEKKNPNDKIQSIMEMIEVVKISLRKEKERGDKQEVFDKHSIEIVLAYCLIRSKPEKILLNINYIEIFLSKEKLLSKQGGALERLKMAVSLIRDQKLIDYLVLDSKDFQDELLKNETLNTVQDMRENQKLTSLIAYI